MFITFEGCEGSGKTTQAKLLVENLNKSGTQAIFTREPGGSALAESIRNLLLSKEISNPLTEFLLITAARLDHVETLIKPSLNNNSVVVCDRFFDSSLAYQGYCKGLDIDLMTKLHSLSLNNFSPDLTFVIDIEPQAALERILRNRDADSINHYDEKDLDFHHKIKNAFLDLSSKNQNRMKVINGALAIDVIQAQILELVSIQAV